MMDKQNKISAVVLAKNEQDNIYRCINSLKFCNEIIVVDDNSTDLTRQIAEENGAKIYVHALNDDFAAQRNFALDKVLNKWILFVDADEIVSPELAEEIKSAILSKDTVGYYIKRVDYFKGKRMNFGETGSKYLLRLARHGAGKWSRKVHEKWKVSGLTLKLKHPLFHYPHPTIKSFIDEIELYSNLHAIANNSERKKSNLIKIVFIPLFKFIDNWIIKGGFLDGNRGIVFALMMSFHSYLSWSKLWLLQRKSPK